MIQYDNNFEAVSVLLFVTHPDSDPSRGQVQFCHNLIKKKDNSPCLQEFPEDKNKYIVDHCLLFICKVTSQYAIFTIEILAPDLDNQTPSHKRQTDDKDLSFSKFFVKYSKSIQHENLTRANSTFTNDIFQ